MPSHRQYSNRMNQKKANVTNYNISIDLDSTHSPYLPGNQLQSMT